MTAAAILSECQRRGVHLRADGELIKYKPIAAVDPELLEAMRERKPELISYLRRHEYDRVGPWSPSGAVAAPHQCVSCGGGLQAGDPDDGICSTCCWSFEHLAPKGVQ